MAKRKVYKQQSPAPRPPHRKRRLVESHATVIIPFDDRVILVSWLDGAEFSSRLSEVAQTLDAISGIQFLVGGSGLKEYKATEGFNDVLVLTRDIGDETEYVLITLWDNMEAVQRFAGPEPERAVYYPEDDHYFPEHERTTYVRHYEVATLPQDESKEVACRPQPA